MLYGSPLGRQTTGSILFDTHLLDIHLQREGGGTEAEVPVTDSCELADMGAGVVLWEISTSP